MDVLEKVRNLPEAPGVYVFKDENGSVLYVGKARSLRKRVASYFHRGGSLDPKHRLLLSRVRDVDFNVTDSEAEALLLECNLIKRFKPPFNVMLRDDKSYPYLAVTLGDDFPRVMVTRNLQIEGAKFFGPYTRAKALRKTLDTLRRIFPLRTCRGRSPGRRSGSPCLYFSIGKCLAPCRGEISREKYRKVVNELLDFMGGRGEKIIERLEREMKKASQNLHFEKAALLRDKIKAASSILEKQKVVSLRKSNFDVVGIYRDESDVYFRVFFVREGKLIGSRGFLIEEADEDVLSQFLVQYYSSQELAPSQIYVPEEFEERKEVESLLAKVRGKSVRIYVPKRGEKAELLKMANANALYSYQLLQLKGKTAPQVITEVLEELQRRLGLPQPPYRIECFDVSNLRGKNAVGAMVVFEDGKPKRKDYRRFKIKGVERSNDFEMMKEVVMRRLRRLQESDEKFKKKPDLIVVDGGKPQLTAALEALKEEKLLNEIPVIALAKREEKIYLPEKGEPIVFPRASLAFKLLQNVRDESHRFAITYHRNLRDVKFSRSLLEDIEGVGRKRAQKLLKRFGNAEEVAKASLSHLREVLPQNIAEKVYDFFRR
jgi:excinuclease ABC subunit C